jgi:hypothetical protein
MGSSSVIESLKTVREKLPDNYSTEQLLDTLDEFLMRAVRGMIRSSRFLDPYLVQIAAWYSTNQRRKISGLEKGQFIATVMAYVLGSPKHKVRIYRRMYLERSLTLELLNRWLKLAEEAARLEIEGLQRPSADKAGRLKHLHRKLGLYDPHLLYPNWLAVKQYTQLAYQFREQIAEKYMRKVALEAVSFHKRQRERTGSRMSLSDIGQNFVLAVYRAIDKCDPRKGTLTAYVDRWLSDARSTNNFRDESGIAYTIPSGQRKRLATGESSMHNYAIPIDDQEVLALIDERDDQEERAIRQDTINMVRK